MTALRMIIAAAASAALVGCTSSTEPTSDQARETTPPNNPTPTVTMPPQGPSQSSAPTATTEPPSEGEFVDGTIEGVQLGDKITCVAPSEGADSAPADEPVPLPCAPADAKIEGTVLVSTPGDGGSQVTYAFIIQADTDIVAATAGRDPQWELRDLRVGTQARFHFDGPVTRSMPAQTTANKIEVYLR